MKNTNNRRRRALRACLALALAPAGALALGQPDDIGLARFIAASGTFQGDNIAQADFDGDGAPDLVGSTVHGGLPSYLALNDGAGGYVGSSLGSVAVTRGIAAGDLDGDGDQDLVFVQGTPTQDAEVWWNDGDANFTQGPTLTTGINIGDERADPVLVADTDGDGDQDVLVAANQTVRHFVNDGAGSFAQTDYDLTAGFWDSARSLRLADMDGDGVDDLVVTAWTTGLLVAQGDGTGGFNLPATRYPIPAGTFGRYELSRLADLEGDGDLDVFVGGTEPELWRNDGGALTYIGIVGGDASLVAGSNLVAGDFDDDGDADVLTRAGHLMENNGDGTFTHVGRTLRDNGAFASGRPTDLFDLDGDGRLDIVMGSLFMTTQATAADPDGGGGGDCEPAPNAAGTVDLFVPNGDRLRAQWALNDGTDTWTANPHFIEIEGSNQSNKTASSGRGDFDADGWTDVAFARYGGDARVGVCFNDSATQTGVDAFSCFDDTVFLDLNGAPIPDGGFGAAPLKQAEVAIADFDGDGVDDLVAGTELCLSNGDRTFTCGSYFLPPNPAAFGVGAADILGDAKPDVFMQSRGIGYVCENLGNDAAGRPQFDCVAEMEFRLGNSLDGLYGTPTLGDLDNDGDTDLAIHRFGLFGQFCLNNGAAGWTCETPPGQILGVGAIIDWDGDGQNEYYAHAITRIQQLWTYDPVSGWSSQPAKCAEAGDGVAHKPDVADIDGDGLPEILSYSQTRGNVVCSSGGYDPNGVPVVNLVDINGNGASNAALFINIDTPPPACDDGPVDSDGDGTPDADDGCPDDADKIEPGACGCGVADTDTDDDGTADCADGCAGDPAKTAPGACGCGTADTDTDDDGAADCLDFCPDDPEKTAPGVCDCGLPDTDSDDDGAADCVDPDDDNDGVDDADDSNPFDPNTCADTDADSCDDCAGGTFDPAADGTDTDSDGLCDAGDPDDDNDGVADGGDSDPLDGNVCADSDGDTCDDCASGSVDPGGDGTDTDGDGLCDAGDPDDDNDGVADGSDSDPLDGTTCADIDADGCDDCSSGVVNPGGDGLDSDGDGLCDVGDPDDDNDGVADVDDSDPLDATTCADSDGDTCDDCVSGGFDPSADGADADGDGLCDAGDPDDDNDGDPDVSDCAPFDATVSNLVTEVCNGLDDNCRDGADERLFAISHAGDGHAIWIPGFNDAGTVRMRFRDDARFVVLADGSARLSGTAHVYDGGAVGEEWAVTLLFERRGFGPAHGGPKIERANLQPPHVTHFWEYFDLTAGTLVRGGLTTTLTQRPADGRYPFQFGEAANNKDADFGGSLWFDWSRSDGRSGHGDFNLDAAPLLYGAEVCDDADNNCDGRVDEYNDEDLDGTADCFDGCPTDGDKVEPGACGCGMADIDTDGDETLDCDDLCPLDPDNDADGDTVCGDLDNCPATPNVDQRNLDGDAQGDVCDDDDDDDGEPDLADNCPETPNADQVDTDGDTAGDACDDDDDDDAVGDVGDNCPLVWNPSQSDLDDNGTGDLCEEMQCTVLHASCRRERRADQRECDLTARMCRRACARRDRDCRRACRDAERQCHTVALEAEQVCRDAACLPHGLCRRAVRADHRECRQDGREDLRSCRRTCGDVDPGLRRDCRLACRQDWRATRDACRAHRRHNVQEICRAPYDGLRACRTDFDDCAAEVDAARRACRSECAHDGACKRACDDERHEATTACVDAQGDCLEEAAHYP